MDTGVRFLTKTKRGCARVKGHDVAFGEWTENGECSITRTKRYRRRARGGSIDDSWHEWPSFPEDPEIRSMEIVSGMVLLTLRDGVNACRPVSR